MPSREDIADITVKRLIKTAPGYSASKNAALVAKKYLSVFLHKLAEKCLKHLAVAKRSTLRDTDIDSVIQEMNICNLKVGRANLADVRGLSMAGTIRVFKPSKAKMNISEKGKETLMDVAEGFLVSLGAASISIASNDNRKTIKDRDVALAAKIMGL